MTTTEVGDSPDWVSLVIRKNSDCDFDVEWWNEDETALIPIVSCIGAVKDRYDGDVLVDLGSVGPHVDVVGGVAQVRINAAFTSGLTALERGVWAMTATSATDTKTLVEGDVRIREDV